MKKAYFSQYQISIKPSYIWEIECENVYAMSSGKNGVYCSPLFVTHIFCTVVSLISLRVFLSQNACLADADIKKETNKETNKQTIKANTSSLKTIYTIAY